MRLCYTGFAHVISTFRERNKMDTIAVARKSLKGGWTVFFALLLVVLSLDLEWIAAYLNINWPLLLLQILMLPVVIRLNKKLSIRPIMKMGILKGSNLRFAGLSASPMGLVVCVLVLTFLPKAAFIEESIFRQGTDTWTEAIARSVLFALAHMLFGVPLALGIVFAFMGIFLSWLYFIGGLPLAIQGHFQHNLLIFLLVGYDISKKLRKK